jgi:hypothetical protein
MAEYQEVLESVRQMSPSEQEQLRRDLEALARGSGTQDQMPKQNRTPGLNRGQILISEDFNDPLPDDYLGLAS